MAIQQINNAGGNGGGAMNQVADKKESNLPKTEPTPLPRPSERVKRLKTGTQKTTELQDAPLLEQKGMRAATANLAARNSAAESGKGNSTKTFG